MSLELNALLEQARAARAENAAGAELADRAKALTAQAERADDYRQIMNAMAKHVFGYYGQIQETELDQYWSRRDDIVYAHGSMAYYGRENVFNYYTGMPQAMKAKFRGIAKRVYGLDFPEDQGPGYKVMNMLLSPYVEIAADRQTARGVWMAYSYMTHPDDEGKPDTALGLTRYAGEFVREDGEWKLWHMTVREDLLEFFNEDDLPPGPMQLQLPRTGGNSPPGNINMGGGGMPPFMMGGPKTLSAPKEPTYPAPYETFDADKFIQGMTRARNDVGTVPEYMMSLPFADAQQMGPPAKGGPGGPGGSGGPGGPGEPDGAPPAEKPAEAQNEPERGGQK